MRGGKSGGMPRWVAQHGTVGLGLAIVMTEHTCATPAACFCSRTPDSAVSANTVGEPTCYGIFPRGGARLAQHKQSHYKTTCWLTQGSTPSTPGHVVAYVNGQADLAPRTHRPAGTIK